MFRNQKVIDLACFVDINFDECTCLRESQMSEFIAFIHEDIFEFKVRLWNQPNLRTQLQTNEQVMRNLP